MTDEHFIRLLIPFNTTWCGQNFRIKHNDFAKALTMLFIDNLCNFHISKFNMSWLNSIQILIWIKCQVVAKWVNYLFNRRMADCSGKLWSIVECAGGDLWAIERLCANKWSARWSFCSRCICRWSRLNRLCIKVECWCRCPKTASNQLFRSGFWTGFFGFGFILAFQCIWCGGGVELKKTHRNDDD